MESAQHFLKLHKKLESHLRRNARTEGRVPYSDILKIAANSGVISFLELARLEAYRKLRNVLVHGFDEYGGRGRESEEIIAYPTDATLKLFGSLVEKICSPPRLINLFQKHVRVFDPDEPLMEPLRYMRSHEFSQVVVRQQGKLNLLTVEEITEWLEAQIPEEVINLRDAVVNHALPARPRKHFDILPGQATVRDAYIRFERSLERGHPRLYAIIFTEHGRADEEPQGIITPWDLMEFARS